MNLDEYQQAVTTTDVRPDASDRAFPIPGLAGEVASLVTEHNKALRSGSNVGYEGEVAEDLGDLLREAAEAVARAAYERGLQPSAPPGPLPVIAIEDIHLVCWQAIDPEEIP